MSSNTRCELTGDNGHPGMGNNLPPYWHTLTSLCCSLKSVLSGRELWEAGDKNPYDYEGSTESKMKVAWGWVCYKRSWLEVRMGDGPVAATRWLAQLGLTGSPADGAKTDEVLALTAKRIGNTRYHVLL